MIRVGIHQPNYIPGLSYFAKILNSDIFILLDSVQFIKRNWSNRNRIKSHNGELMLSIPVLTKGKKYQRIDEVVVDNDREWRKKHLASIEHCYKKAAFFQEYAPKIYEILSYETYSLSEMNIHIIKELCRLLGIDSQFVLSSELDCDRYKSTELLIELVKKVGGNVYLSGPSGKKYMNPEMFRQAGIDLEISLFTPAEYPQLWSNFVSNLSIIDLLLNAGPDSSDILKKSCKVENW